MPEQLPTGLRALTPTRQIMLMVIVSASVAALAAGFFWSREPEMQVLFSNLTQEDAGAIVAKLKEQKIPYSVEGTGGTILVPTERVHETRLQMASQSLPQGGGVGFEIFDRTTIGMTDFVQKLNYRRALQGELSRTISQLAEVERARVHLVVPERSLFADQRERPRASVVVTLKRGKTLSAGQVQGIGHLVASSVEGLQPQEVTIVDSHGQALSLPMAADAASQQTSAHMDAKRSLEKDLENRVQTMLERVAGAGKAVVRVSSVLNLRQVERTEEAYDPNGQVVRSENRQQEKNSSSSTGGDGGVAGTGSNLPGNAAASPEGSSSNTAVRTNATVNYEINKTVSRIVEPVGTITRLTVAVLVDGRYETAEGKDGKLERKYVPRKDEEMKKLEELVKKAVGYSEERGDQVEILNVAFDAAAVEIGEAGPADVPPPNPMMGQYIRYGLFSVLAALVFLFVIRPLMRLLAEPGGAPQQLALPAGAVLPATVGQLEAAMAPAQLSHSLLESARINPQSTAMVVKKWLKEK